jgi:RsiW-degrading membrane proteinase PrsW (M82 family)
MKLTRLSLFYLISYLTIGGILLTAAPGFALKIFLSNGNYTWMILRLLGVFFISLAMVMAGIVYYKTEALYPVTVLVRLFIISSLLIFYYHTKDNMFLVLTGVVGLGIILTGTSFLIELNKKK